MNLPQNVGPNEHHRLALPVMQNLYTVLCLRTTIHGIHMSDNSTSRSTCFLALDISNSMIGLTAIREVPITLCASPYISNSPFNTSTQENTNRLETELKSGRNEALFSKFQLLCLLPSTSVLSRSFITTRKYKQHTVKLTG